MKKSCYILLILITLSIWITGCTHSSIANLLAKAKSMEADQATRFSPAPYALRPKGRTIN